MLVRAATWSIRFPFQAPINRSDCVRKPTFVFQAMFNRSATSQNIAWQTEFAQQCCKKIQETMPCVTSKQCLKTMFCDVAKRSNILLEKQIFSADASELFVAMSVIVMVVERLISAVDAQDTETWIGTEQHCNCLCISLPSL